MQHNRCNFRLRNDHWCSCVQWPNALHGYCKLLTCTNDCERIYKLETTRRHYVSKCCLDPSIFHLMIAFLSRIWKKYSAVRLSISTTPPECCPEEMSTEMSPEYCDPLYSWSPCSVFQSCYCLLSASIQCSHRSDPVQLPNHEASWHLKPICFCSTSEGCILRFQMWLQKLLFNSSSLP